MRQPTRLARLCVSVFLLLAVCPIALGQAAQTTQATLPAAYADFALNPVTGDLAAVDPDRSVAVLHTAGDLKAGKPQPAKTVKVGPNPVAITYKPFGDKAYYAVVSAQDAQMQIIQADSFELIERIELGQVGGFVVVGSKNRDDPFIYFSNGRETGAVNLREMRLTDLKLDDAKDFVISADGLTAYRRRANSPSGFESLVMQGRFTDDTPRWARRYYAHDTRGGYLPDAQGQFTITNKKVYNAALTQSVAQLKFEATLFFPDRPLVFGIDPGLGRHYNSFGGPDKPPADLTIRAASTNSFQNVGQPVRITLGVNGSNKLQNVPSKMENKNVRMFADAKRQRVVVAYMNRVVMVPLSAFKLPDEPMLFATLEHNGGLIYDKAQTLRVTTADKRVKVKIIDSPADATVKGSTLAWKPGANDIGMHSIAVELTHGALKRTQRFDVEVAYPSLQLPFNAAGAALGPQGKVALVWEGPTLDRNGRPTPNQGKNTYRVAVVKLDSGQVLAEREIASAIENCTVGAGHAILWSKQHNPRCEVLRLKDLKRVTALIATGPVNNVFTTDKLAILQTQNTLEAYNEKMQRVRQFGQNQNNRHHFPRGNAILPPVSSYGLHYQGTLYDDDLKPILITSPGQLPNLANHQRSNRGMNHGLPQPLSSTSTPQHLTRPQMPNKTSRLSIATINNTFSVTLGHSKQTVRVPGATHTNQTQDIYTIAKHDVTGSQRQTLINHEHYNSASRRYNTQPSQPILVADDPFALVISEDRLYRWDYPQADENVQAPGMRWKPTQSAISLSEGKTTTLKHTITDGKGELNFELTYNIDGITIDKTTGDVTIENEKVLAAATLMLINQTHQQRHERGGIETPEQAIARIGSPYKKIAKHLLGKEPAGVPVAIPIQIEVGDDALQTRRLWYYVFAQVSDPQLLAAMKARHEKHAALEEERRKQAERAQAERARRLAERGLNAADAEEPGEAEPGNREAQLARRIEQLERRVNLLTRQIELLMLELQQQRKRDATDEAQEPVQEQADAPRRIPQLEEAAE